MTIEFENCLADTECGVLAVTNFMGILGKQKKCDKTFELYALYNRCKRLLL